MTSALEIIGDAYERCNRLSPGETLGADEAAFGFRRLNAFVDELSAAPAFLFRNLITSVAQSGHITLGVAAWAAVSPGDDIVSLAADGWLLGSIEMTQYNEIPVQTTVGMPDRYAPDGFDKVYLYPVPNGQLLRMQTRRTVSAFADQTTDYTLPAGWKAALAAGLALRMAPNIMSQIPASLATAAKTCLNAVWSYKPAIVDVYTYTQPAGHGNILTGP